MTARQFDQEQAATRAKDASSSIVLATRNKGKINEFAALLEPFGLRVLGLDDFPFVAEVEETGVTFEENALLKACTVSRATGLVAVADDSGIEVDALGGKPGVHSARYSESPESPATDARNVAKLLAELRKMPSSCPRTARFRCCMAACAPTGVRLTAEAAWEGVVTQDPLGDNGFGYDPIFFDQEIQRTAAQMSKEEKNGRSHRAKAVAALLRDWPAFWENWLATVRLF